MNKGKLRELIVQSLDISEFKNMCQDLSVNYDGLAGDEIESKSRELIEYLDRRVRLDQLLKHLQLLRPHFDVDEILEGDVIQEKLVDKTTHLAENDINYLIKSLQKIVDDVHKDEAEEITSSSSLLELSLYEIAMFIAALPDDRSRTDDGRDGRMRNFREGWTKGSKSRDEPSTKRINFNRVTWRTLGWYIGALAGRDYATPKQTRAIFNALGAIRNSRDDKPSKSSG